MSILFKSFKGEEEEKEEVEEEEKEEDFSYVQGYVQVFLWVGAHMQVGRCALVCVWKPEVDIRGFPGSFFYLNF